MFAKSPATCLGFLPGEGYVLAGHMNCSFSIYNPRNYQLKQVKRLNNISSYPVIDLRVIQGGFRFLVLNAAAEFILATRSSPSSLKFNGVGVYKGDFNFPYMRVKTIEFYEAGGAMAAIISEERVKIFWVDFQETNSVRPLYQFSKPGTNLKNFSPFPSCNISLFFFVVKFRT